MKKLFIYLFAALAVASCEHKDLCYDHSHTIDVEVVFDWRNASEAAPESYVALPVPDKRRRGTAL